MNMITCFLQTQTVIRLKKCFQQQKIIDYGRRAANNIFQTILTMIHLLS